MQKDSRFFDDIAKMASGAVGTISDAKREIEAIIMDKVEKILYRMNLVRREEFEVVRQMVEATRLEQEKLKAEIAELKK
ncbi:MAG: accessory factor UbiK family protein [Pseudomonadota bacterium]